MRDARTLLPLAAALLLWACDDGGSATPQAADVPLPADATRGVDQGLPNPDAAQPHSETAPPRPTTPPAATETTVDDAPPEQIVDPGPVTTPADPGNPGGLPPGESVDAPPPTEEADEPTGPTEPMA